MKKPSRKFTNVTVPPDYKYPYVIRACHKETTANQAPEDLSKSDVISMALDNGGVGVSLLRPF